MQTLEGAEGTRYEILRVVGCPIRGKGASEMNFRHGNNQLVCEDKRLVLKRVNEGCPLANDKNGYLPPAFDGLQIRPVTKSTGIYTPIKFNPGEGSTLITEARSEVTLHLVLPSIFTLRGCGVSNKCNGCPLNNRAELTKVQAAVERRAELCLKGIQEVEDEYLSGRTGWGIVLGLFEALQVRFGIVPSTLKEVSDVRSALNTEIAVLKDFVQILQPAS